MGVSSSEVSSFINQPITKTICSLSGKGEIYGPHNQEMLRGLIHENCEERGDWLEPLKTNGLGKKSVTESLDLSATNVAIRMKERLFHDAKVFIFWS